MGFIRTMTGDISSEDLGFTYSHEHIFCIPPHWQEKGADDLLLDDEEKSFKEVVDFKNAGGNSIIDATCIDYGRDVAKVKKIADATGINIVATAGFNKGILWDAKMPGKNITFNEWLDSQSIDQLVDFIVNDVEKGVENTNIRCGQIKFGTGYNNISPLEVKTIRAACRAHHITKAPLHAHTEAGTMILEQIEYLREEVIDLHNISFGHLDRNLDPWLHNKIAETGAYLCFDGIGKMKYAPESERIRCILLLVKHGFQKQILISGDTARKSYYKNYEHGIGLEYIIRKWIPRFMEEADQCGLDGKNLIQDFFVNNPANCFSFKK